VNLVYIHGASASADSFNYIRHHLNHPIETVIEYNSYNGFKNNLNRMRETISQSRDSIFFVAHSLGGIYALHLAQHFFNRVAGAVTLSTPYGGCREAVFAQFFLPFNQLMRDISPGSEPMSSVPKMSVPKRWTNVVTTCGSSPFITAPNDGVVTMDSMKHLSDQMELVFSESTHYEVVLSPETVNIITNRI
jgi:pimeloyl-ACP methyl ester carboxylesterase